MTRYFQYLLPQKYHSLSLTLFVSFSFFFCNFVCGTSWATVCKARIYYYLCNATTILYWFVLKSQCFSMNKVWSTLKKKPFLNVFDELLLISIEVWTYLIVWHIFGIFMFPLSQSAVSPLGVTKLPSNEMFSSHSYKGQQCIRFWPLKLTSGWPSGVPIIYK